jgi:hypothetical protein
MADINQLLVDALIYVGSYSQGQTPNSDDLALAFRVINRKLDSLSAEKLSMIGMKLGQYPLSSGQGWYTYGPGLNWNATTRPIKIKSASTVDALLVEHPARITTADEYAMIPDKSRQGAFAEAIFYDNGFPTGNVYMTPKPISSGANMWLWTFEAIPLLPAQTGTVNFAPGFEEAIVPLAAVDLCIAFQRPVTQELMAVAAQAKSVIVQLCAELFDAPAPPPAGPSPVAPPAQRTT